LAGRVFRRFGHGRLAPFLETARKGIAFDPLPLRQIAFARIGRLRRTAKADGGTETAAARQRVEPGPARSVRRNHHRPIQS